MLKIKLTPTGKKHEPHYRVIVASDRSKLTGAPVVTLGHYHPLQKQLEIDRDLLKVWLEKGAQPTPKIKKLLNL